MSHGPRILFFFVGRSGFVAGDIAGLSKNFDVREKNFPFTSKWKTPFLLLNQLLWILIYGWKTDGMICQLAGYHSFIPVLFGRCTGKPVLIIAGGTDCHYLPSIGYGNYTRKLLSVVTKFSFKKCSYIAPKHESLWNSSYTYSKEVPSPQGIQPRIPGIKTPWLAIPNGYDGTAFSPTGEKIPGSFLTVSGNLENAYQIPLKGIDLILRVAVLMPQARFTIIGNLPRHLIPESATNIQSLPAMPHDQLREIYGSHAFYLQLSMAEGFPNALCEAMLCECVPVGSRVFSIPEIINDTGYILDFRDSEELKNLLNKVLEEYNPNRGKAARSRILRYFTKSNRQESLIRLVNHLISG